MGLYDDDDDDDGDFGEAIEGLMEVGALDEVGAAAVKKLVNRGVALKRAVRSVTSKGGLPSPSFETTAPATKRRAPLGFLEDGTGSVGWSLAAVLGDTTIIRAQVSRVTHINRLLLVASAVGAVITSLKIGDVEQMLNGAVSVELYGTAALTDTLPDDFSPLKSGTDCIITLQNTTAGAITGTAGAKAFVKR
jgi:hypothetical protein